MSERPSLSKKLKLILATYNNQHPAKIWFDFLGNCADRYLSPFSIKISRFPTLITSCSCSYFRYLTLILNWACCSCFRWISWSRSISNSFSKTKIKMMKTIISSLLLLGLVLGKSSIYVDLVLLMSYVSPCWPRIIPLIKSQPSLKMEILAQYFNFWTA